MMNPVSILSSTVHRSQSDRDLLTVERRVTRTRLVSSSSTFNLSSLNTTSSYSEYLTRKSSAFLPWDRLEKWIYGIAVVNFDLELGHSLELILPNHCKLTDEEKKSLSYSAFPDTNSKCCGDIQYHFRLNHQSILPSYYQLYNAIVPPALQVDPNSLFGYVNFRQIRQKNLRRGYFQKSFVILSKLPFFSLFLTLAKRFAIHYFENGQESLELCCQQMDSQWPEPKPGETLRLPFLDHIFQVRIPTHGDKPFSSSDLIQFRSTLQEATTTTSTNHSQIVKFPIDDDTEIDSPLSNLSTSDHEESEVNSFQLKIIIIL